MLYLNITDITIITAKNDFPCIIANISKSKVINLLENTVLEKVGIFKKYCLNFQSVEGSRFFTFFCLVYLKRLKLWASICP